MEGVFHPQILLASIAVLSEVLELLPVSYTHLDVYKRQGAGVVERSRHLDAVCLLGGPGRAQSVSYTHLGLHTCYNGAYKEKRPRESKWTS